MQQFCAALGRPELAALGLSTKDQERLKGEIAIEVHPVSMGRVKVVIRAPKSVGVRRQKGEEQ